MTEPEIQPTAEEKAVAEALMAQRPVPTPVFRGTLGETLTNSDPGYGHRPARLWVRAGVLAGSGALLVLLGLLVSTGAI
jgi:hypothetical protein